MNTCTGYDSSDTDVITTVLESRRLSWGRAGRLNGEGVNGGLEIRGRELWGNRDGDLWK